MQACFLPADILLPDAAADVEKWAVVACDQFTSQMEYWQKAAQIVGDAPEHAEHRLPGSLSRRGRRANRAHSAGDGGITMQRGVLQTRVKNGFVFVRRVTESGERLGLVGKLDLEQYDFHARYIRARSARRRDDSLAHSAARAHPSGAPIESPLCEACR